jgi:hypothetical protein
MDTALLVIMLVIGNLSLYWLFYGKKKFEQKLQKEVDNGRKTTGR